MVEALDIFPLEIWNEIALSIPTLKDWLNFGCSCQVFRGIISRTKTKEEFQNKHIRWNTKGEWWGVKYQALPNGVSHGEYIERGDEYIIECFYYEGEKHGLYTKWGKEEKYIDNRRFFSYYPQVQGLYNHGAKVGEWRERHSSEILNLSEWYENGLRHGPYLEWWDLLGKLVKYEGEWNCGKQRGLWTWYDHHGSVIEQINFN